jgi:hypothetical protein
MKTQAVFVLIILFTMSEVFSQTLQFKGGHSHNDYYQNKPLFNAIDNGMVSIEADVFLQNGELLTGHTIQELKSSRSLVSLYLQPLSEMIVGSGNFNPIVLMIDIKKDGEAVYRVLKEILKPYQHILTHYTNDSIEKRQVTIILSGARPIELIKNENDRYVFLDGRISDLENKELSHVFPLISDDWKSHFSWNGKGKMPEYEIIKLKNIVNECHNQNKMIRFWGTTNKNPYNENVWKALMEVNVDLIGSDCPHCLKLIMMKNKKYHNENK